MAKFELDDAPAKKSKPTGWLAAAVALILAGGFGTAYYLPLKSAHALLMSEHEALAKKSQELDHALKSSGADLQSTSAEREKLKQALRAASEKEESFLKDVEALRDALKKGLEKNSKFVTLESATLGAHARAKTSLIYRPNSAKLLPFGSKFACGAAGALSGRSGSTITVSLAPDAEDKDGFTKASEQAAAIADVLRTSCKLSADQVRVLVGPGSKEELTLRVETGEPPSFSPKSLLD